VRECVSNTLCHYALLVLPGRAIHHFIKHNVLTNEELLGIEQMIGQKFVWQILDERKAHAQLVLNKHAKLKEMNRNGDSTEELARQAVTKSIAHVDLEHF
jgi:hypothetical protein